MLYKVILAAGPQHREIGTPISTNNASWRGPNTEAGGKSAYKQCKLGWYNEMNFVKISFLSHPLTNMCIKKDVTYIKVSYVRIFMINFRCFQVD
ncbi:hypothetical protein B9Y44_10060 [Staphylococcus aureus]|nr:hypothetical protein B9Y44_10060 [Staphylococcus aureus]